MKWLNFQEWQFHKEWEEKRLSERLHKKRLEQERTKNEELWIQIKNKTW